MTICLIASSMTINKANFLTRFIKDDKDLQNNKVLDPITIEAYDLQKATNSILEIISNHGNEPVTINLTGGTKIMSLACLLAAKKKKNVSLQYVSTEDRELLFFDAENEEFEKCPYFVKINVNQYMNAHGIETHNNRYFAKKHKNPIPPRVGDALEQAIYNSCKNSDLFDDIQQDVFIRKWGSNTYADNELDVVVTHNGSLAVCECKSGDVTNDVLYKLEALSQREIAGIYCGKALAASKSRLTPSITKRAKKDGISIIYQEQTSEAARIIFETIK